MKTKIGLSIAVVVLSVVCIWLAGRGTKPTQQMPTEADLEKSVQDSGVSIRRVGVFDDDIATGGKRGIYRIHDSETGEDYIGISGINITPSHPRPAGDPIPTP